MLLIGLRRCVGVWDTVGSVFNTINALSITDTDLPASIDCALHAMSLQENREKFLPTLWTVPSRGLVSLANGSPQVFKQVSDRTVALSSCVYLLIFLINNRFGSLVHIQMLVAVMSVTSFPTSLCSGWR